VFVVDDDSAVRESLTMLLRIAGYAVQVFDSAKRFLHEERTAQKGCLIVDIRMPDMDGLELQQELIRRGSPLPVIVVTGHGDVPLAVQAMKAGAIDFLEKPFARDVLLDAVRRALDRNSQGVEMDLAQEEIGKRLATLTAREREVYEGVVAGKQSKTIAFELGTSPRTIEIHRSRMMHKLQARSLQELVRMALAEKTPPRR
jgi:two-component system response regulator FixJ